MNRRRATGLEVARAIHRNESLRVAEPAELTHDEVCALFEDTKSDCPDPDYCRCNSVCFWNCRVVEA
jgi:hypothetical protein